MSSAGWRLAARLARRETRRRPGRTVLAGLLIAVPVMAMTIGSVLARTENNGWADQFARRYGSADIAVDGFEVGRPSSNHTGVCNAAMLDELREHVSKVIGPIAKPDDIRFTDALPKTRSGKIMRRLLRDIAAGSLTVGDTTTLEDFSVLAKLREDEE